MPFGCLVCATRHCRGATAARAFMGGADAFLLQPSSKGRIAVAGSSGAIPALKLRLHECPQLGALSSWYFFHSHGAAGGVDQKAGEPLFLAGRGGLLVVAGRGGEKCAISGWCSTCMTRVVVVGRRRTTLRCPPSTMRPMAQQQHCRMWCRGGRRSRVRRQGRPEASRGCVRRRGPRSSGDRGSARGEARSRAGRRASKLGRVKTTCRSGE